MFGAKPPVYPYTQTTIINGGGIDGGYGNATESAVKIYQQKKWPNKRWHRGLSYSAHRCFSY